MMLATGAASALARGAARRLLGGGTMSTSAGGFAPSLSSGAASLSSSGKREDDSPNSTTSSSTTTSTTTSATSTSSLLSRPLAAAAAVATAAASSSRPPSMMASSSSSSSSSSSAAAAAAAATSATARAFSSSASSSSSSSSSPYITDDDNDNDPSSPAARAARPTTPWVRSVVSGVDLMRNPKYNKGLAFSEDERDRLYLRGLLPPAVLPMKTQAARAMVNVRSKAADIDKLTYLSSLQERNQSLFHRALADHVEELLPVWGEPTLSRACAAHGLMFRSLPRALFIGLRDRGRVAQILKNWPERRVKVLCVTDGERVGGGGAWATEGGGGAVASSSDPSSSSSSQSTNITGIDLGVQAVGVPVARLALYAAVGGVDPSVCLPIAIDAGTDNADLLSSPFYVGSRRPRARGDEYEALLDELLSAARARFGPSLFVDFENMRFRTLRAAFGAYRGAFPCYSDDIQGTAAVAVAALLSACRATGRSLKDQTFLFVGGDSPAGSHVAEMVAEAISRGLGEVETGGSGRGKGSSSFSSSSASSSTSSLLEATSRIWVADSKGLVTRSRADADSLPDHVLPYCRDVYADDGSKGEDGMMMGGGSRCVFFVFECAFEGDERVFLFSELTSLFLFPALQKQQKYFYSTPVAVGPGLLAAVKAVKPTVLIGKAESEERGFQGFLLFFSHFFFFSGLEEEKGEEKLFSQIFLSLFFFFRSLFCLSILSNMKIYSLITQVAQPREARASPAKSFPSSAPSTTTTTTPAAAPATAEPTAPSSSLCPTTRRAGAGRSRPPTPTSGREAPRSSPTGPARGAPRPAPRPAPSRSQTEQNERPRGCTRLTCTPGSATAPSPRGPRACATRPCWPPQRPSPTR